MSTIADFRARLSGVRSDGNGGLMALCPCHDDHDPSLHVWVDEAGELAHDCKAGCNWKTVHAELERIGLCPPGGNGQGRQTANVNPTQYSDKRTGERLPIVEFYDYPETGPACLYTVGRTPKNSAGEKNFPVWRRRSSGGYDWGLGTAPRVLYHRARLRAAAATGEAVVIAEGEKDVETLERTGWVATTNSGGAGTWPPEFAAEFKGVSLAVILNDNDDAGRKRGEKIASALTRVGVPHVIVNLPDLPEKGDVSDWFAAGHTNDELETIIAEQTNATNLKALAETARPTAAQNGERESAYHLTELGNAERFAARHAGQVRVPRGHGLLAYDQRRGIYVPDHAVLLRYAKVTVRCIYGEAAEHDDEKARKAIAAHAHRSESKRAMDAMLALATAEEALEADIREFDAAPELLNCTNGVVNLRTGEHLPHSPDHCMTKIAGAAYNPSAKAPAWRAHLERIFEDDPEIITFLQRLYGYALTGYSREQVFVVFYGEGANGKSDTVFGMAKALGSGGLDSYQRATAITTFMPHRNDHIRNSLAALAGARLVTTSENRIDQKLDEGLIKEITGGEDITARFLNHEDFSFRPQFLLLISTNHKPKVECPDYAFKRRVLLVPFNVTLPESEWDRHHEEKLAAELDGILTWGVEGAVEYLAGGLRIPEKVRAATEAYREEMDPLHAFQQEYVILDSAAFTPTATIRATLEKWAKEEGVKELPSPNELAAWLGGRGCVSDKHRGTRGWRGVRLFGADTEQSFNSEEGAS